MSRQYTFLFFTYLYSKKTKRVTPVIQQDTSESVIFFFKCKISGEEFTGMKPDHVWATGKNVKYSGWCKEKADSIQAVYLFKRCAQAQQM